MRGFPLPHRRRAKTGSGRGARFFRFTELRLLPRASHPARRATRPACAAAESSRAPASSPYGMPERARWMERPRRPEGGAASRDSGIRGRGGWDASSAVSGAARAGGGGAGGTSPLVPTSRRSSRSCTACPRRVARCRALRVDWSSPVSRQGREREAFAAENADFTPTSKALMRFSGWARLRSRRLLSSLRSDPARRSPSARPPTSVR